MQNPCVKTGCVAQIAGYFWRGDLFDLGGYYLLNCNQPRFVDETPHTVNLEAETWHDTFQSDRVVMIPKNRVTYFDYNGKQEI